MFVDEALRKSLDQLTEVECGTAPIENFAREWFERFTVGLEAHNEGDVKRYGCACADVRARVIICEGTDGSGVHIGWRRG